MLYAKRARKAGEEDAKTHASKHESIFIRHKEIKIFTYHQK